MPGFMSSSIALTVYTVADVSAVTAEKLRQFHFQPIDDLPEPRGWGWTNIDDMFDAQWDTSVPQKGGFLCFGLRVDARRVSGGVIRKHLAESLREEEALAAQKGIKVPRSRRKELKELLTARLLSRAEPVPSSTEVALDTSTGLMYVASATSSALELFEEFFESSFGTRPERRDVDPAEGHKLLRAIYEHGLTVTFEGHDYVLSEGGRASLVHPESGATVSAKDEPDTIAQSLESGLQFARLKVCMARKDEADLEWECMLGSDGGLSGLKTPRVEPDADEPDAAWLEKFYLLHIVVGVLHSEFARLQE